MPESAKVGVELCQSNSIGSHYAEPRVIEFREVSETEAVELTAKRLANDYYWRRQPEDRTGN